jgi:tetratricopeptide (TPR) repeat protein
VLLACVALCLGPASCGKDDEEGGGTTGPQLTAEELNALGWEAFTGGAYTSAVGHFEAAVALNGGFEEARLGLGWACASVGRYDDAMSAFGALLAGAYATDAYAGLAAAALPHHPDQAVAAAQTALSRDGAYSFYKRPSYDHRDLHLVLAEAHFALAEYAAAQAQVELLDPGVVLDPQAPGYVQALAAEIERLGTLLAPGLPD